MGLLPRHICQISYLYLNKKMPKALGPFGYFDNPVEANGLVSTRCILIMNAYELIIFVAATVNRFSHQILTQVFNMKEDARAKVG